MTFEMDIHPAKLVDLPLLRRLADSGVVMDSEALFTRETAGTHSALLSSVILPQRGLHTLVGRAKGQPIIGQLRLKATDHLAQITFIAPDLEATEARSEDTAWLHMFDAMAAEAGRRNAYMLTAEVDEHSPLFVTMRNSGFAVYARQEIWRRGSEVEGVIPLPSLPLPGVLADETDDDTMDIQLLYSNIVPRLVQPITLPSRESRGIVYRCAGRVQGYIAVSEGRGGLYVMPYLHPDVLGSEAAAIIAGVITAARNTIRSAERLPVYVCVRRYQDWLAESLAFLGFASETQQAVMVRHIAAGIRQAQFARITVKGVALEVMPQTAHPPTRIIQPIDAENGLS